MKKIIYLILLFSFLFQDFALAESLNDSYLSAYTNTASATTNENFALKKNAIILVIGVINALFAFAPLWLLIFSSISAISNAPMNEHYNRIVQGEPYKFFLMTFVILIISYALHTFLFKMLEVSLLKDYAPLFGSGGLSGQFWTLTPPDAISGRYGDLTLSIMKAVVSSRQIIEMIAYFTLILIIVASMLFTFTYFSSFSTNKDQASLFFSACVATIVFLIVSYLYNLIATPILNTENTALGIGQTWIKEGLKYFTNGEIS